MMVINQFASGVMSYYKFEEEHFMCNIFPETIVFGNNVNKIREQRGLRIKQITEIVGYDRGCWSKMEKGEQDIELSTVVKIAKTLDVYLPLLFSRDFSCLDDESIRGYVEEDYLMIFASNVKRTLEKLNKKQVYIYAVTGMDESNINKILKEKNNNPQISTLVQIANGLQQDMASMFRRNG